MHKHTEFSAQIRRIFPEDSKIGSIATVTIQITEDCCCRCSYCYQHSKTSKYMTEDTAGCIVDQLFDMYSRDDKSLPINKDTQGLILDFIGGEPLMNIDIIDFICTRFFGRCISEDHPWLIKSRISMISNGTYYFKESSQKFFKKFRPFLSFNITLDGPEEIHNSCRVYPDGSGNFNDAFKALNHYRENFENITSTKVTIAKENLSLLDTIIKFFIQNGFNQIQINPAFEPEWNIQDAKHYYSKMKQIADYILDNNLTEDIEFALFKTSIGEKLPETQNSNWCGGTGKMLAFGTDGKAYPCVRYTPTSLDERSNNFIIGDKNGLYSAGQQKQILSDLKKITRKSQSTDECFNCPVGSGCAWCSAWNYEWSGDVNKRCTNICWMHRARVLANVYYWNKLYIKTHQAKFFKNNLPEDIALQIISKEELQILKELEYKAMYKEAN